MSKPEILRLVYLSTAIEHFRSADIEALLAKARKKNSELGITGILVCHEDSFFQVLEGPIGDVEALFGAISRDPRHCAVTVLSRLLASERVFGQWTMGYARPEDLIEDHAGAVDDLRELMADRMPDAIEDRRVGVLLTSFLNSFRELRISG